MTKIESIQSKIIGRMQDVLTNEQLQRLENVLAIEFHGIEVQEECTQLVTSEVHWQKILRTFIASKRIEMIMYSVTLICKSYACFSDFAVMVLVKNSIPGRLLFNKLS